jgi:hypothetical protein
VSGKPYFKPVKARCPICGMLRIKSEMSPDRLRPWAHGRPRRMCRYCKATRTRRGL